MSGNLNFLEPSGSLQAVTGLIYLLLIIDSTISHTVYFIHQSLVGMNITQMDRLAL